jgi:hypothetical protein
LPTTDTTINTQKKKITGSSLVVKKINLAVEAYLVEELACWTNVTAAPSHYDAVVRTLDTFPLVRPFLSISHKNISDSSLWLSDHEELFLHSSLPFAARILDRVVAKMYLGVERFLEWHFHSFVTLFWNAAEVSCYFVMETIDLYMMYDSIEEYSCQQIAFYFITIGMVGPRSCCKLRPFESSWFCCTTSVGRVCSVIY